MSYPNQLKLGVLVSGYGSNLQAIIDACEIGTIDAKVEVVISDNPDAFALERAKKHQIPAVVVPHPNGEVAIKTLKQYQVELICLAGFMKILSPQFIKEFPHKIINIHPALLPAFPGLHAQRKAFEYGVKVTGVTVHFVDEGCDTGPIILQSVVPVLDNDTEETLRERILREEHKIYPQAIHLIATKALKIIGRRVIKQK